MWWRRGYCAALNHACVLDCVSVYACACVRALARARVRVRVRECVCARVLVRVRAHVRVHVRVRLYTHTCACACIRPYLQREIIIAPGVIHADESRRVPPNLARIPSIKHIDNRTTPPCSLMSCTRFYTYVRMSLTVCELHAAR